MDWFGLTVGLCRYKEEKKERFPALYCTDYFCD